MSYPYWPKRAGKPGRMAVKGSWAKNKVKMKRYKLNKYVSKIKVVFGHSCKLMMMTKARGPRLISWYPGPSLPSYTLIMRRQRLWPRPGSHPPSPGWQGQNKLSVNVPDQFEGIYGFTPEFKEYIFYIPPHFCVTHNKCRLIMRLIPVRFPRGLAPRMARLTFAFRPSMIGFGSFRALSAASLSAIMTWKQRNQDSSI